MSTKNDQSFLGIDRESRVFHNLGRLRNMMSWKRHRRPILITGHPRCGTNSAAALCQKLGLDVGHEAMGAQGICSWMMAVDDWYNPYSDNELGRSRYKLKWDWMFLVVRDLEAAVPSVMLQNQHALYSYAFRRKHIRRRIGIDLDDVPDAMAKAVLSIVCWSRIVVAQSPHFVFRVEDQQEQFRDFLVGHGIASTEAAGLRISEKQNVHIGYHGQSFERPEIAPDAWVGLASAIKDQVAWYCGKFGYRDPTR